MSSNNPENLATPPQKIDFVILFGQIRDNLACVDKVYAQYADRPNTQIILTTWLKTGKKVDGLYGPSQLRLVFGDEVARAIPYHTQGSKFYGFYPGLRERMVLEDAELNAAELQRRYPKLVIDIEEERFSLNFTSPRGDLNSKRMLYKWWRGVRVIDHVTSNQNVTPAKVMLLRTDRLPFNWGVLEQDVGANQLYIDKWEEVTAGDMLLMSSYKNMRNVSNLFSLCDMEPERPWIGIHRELNQRVRDLNLLPVHDKPLCDVRNFNKVGEFEAIARKYFADPKNHEHVNVRYVHHFLSAIHAAKSKDVDQMNQHLGTLAEFKFKEDVALWLCHYYCHTALGNPELVLLSIVAAIYTAIHNNVAFFKKCSLKPNDTYLVSAFIGAYRQYFGKAEVFEAEQEFSKNFNSLVARLGVLDEFAGKVPLSDEEKTPEAFSAFVQEIYDYSPSR